MGSCDAAQLVERRPQPRVRRARDRACERAALGDRAARELAERVAGVAAEHRQPDDGHGADVGLAIVERADQPIGVARGPARRRERRGTDLRIGVAGEVAQHPFDVGRAACREQR